MKLSRTRPSLLSALVLLLAVTGARAAEPTVPNAASRVLLEDRLLFMGFVGSLASWLKPTAVTQGPYVLPTLLLTRAESRASAFGTYAYAGTVRLGVDLGYRVRLGRVELASGIGVQEDWGFNLQGTTGGANVRELDFGRAPVPVVLTLNLVRVSFFF